MIRRISLLFVLLCLSIYGSVKKVPADFPKIQDAINASTNGDTVLVSPGTYHENIIFKGKKIVVGSMFLTTNDFSFINNTIIDGSTPVNSDTASCVLFINGEDSTSVLAGFTLTGGKGTRWTDEHGAGVYYEGGGILTALSSPIIRNNIIINNEAIRRISSASAGGGGIRSGDGAPKIINNIIISNSGMYGGGIVLNYCAGAVVKNNIISKNKVFQAVAGVPTYGGGGIWINNQLPGNSTKNIIENNTIVDNSASGTTPSGWAGRGGGIFFTSSQAAFTNNIIWNNTQSTGKQFNVASGSTSVTYSNIQDGYTGTGNISSEPMFADSNFYLSAGSPMIDAGNPDVMYNDPVDPLHTSNALFPSMGTLRADIGAYGGPGRSNMPSGVTSVKENTGSLNYNLEQNYPNPFNPSTAIRYSVTEGSNTRLKIYNVTGEEVITLVNEFQSPGNYVSIWNSRNSSGALVSSGVYFYRMESGSFTDVKKMVLIR